MSRIILPPALDFVFVLIKSPLQQKLMTGAHPVTVAPLVHLIYRNFPEYGNRQIKFHPEMQLDMNVHAYNRLEKSSNRGIYPDLGIISCIFSLQKVGNF